MPLPRTCRNRNRQTNNDNSSGSGSPLSRSLPQEDSEVQECKNSPKNRPRRKGAQLYPGPTSRPPHPGPTY
eukprot:2690985-Ditylum_brightwellii.AAC.1